MVVVLTAVVSRLWVVMVVLTRVLVQLRVAEVAQGKAVLGASGEASTLYLHVCAGLRASRNLTA